MNEVLEELDRKRDALISLHQHIRSRVSAAVESDFDHYEQRSVVHNLLDAPRTRFDLNAMAQEFQLGKAEMDTLLKVVKQRLERQLGERAGHIVASTSDRDFRYWLGDL